MARNTGHRVEFKNTTKRDKARRNVRAVEGAGKAKEKVVRNGNLSPHGRKRYLFKDKDGKVEGYGTQYSDVRFDPDTKTYVAYPTIVDGKLMSSDDAFAHYRKTGEHFHRAASEAEARQAAAEAHDESAEDNLAWWNNYIADNLGKGVLAPNLEAMSKDEGFMRWARGEEPDNPMKRVVHQDAKGGEVSAVPSGEPVPQGDPAPQSGPRIVINPTTFKNSKDALCVAFNEAFRIIMEANGFNPASEPTEKQRKFFADTAYADDEVMLRRTILARICTFDTSVSDPTDEQLQEALEFLNTVLEIGAPQNQWEQWAVRRIVAMLQKVVGLEAEEPAEPEGGPTNADVGGGASAEDEELKRLREGASGVSVQDDTSTVEEREQFLAERGMDTSLAETGSMQQLQQMHEEQLGGGAEAPKPDEPAAAAQPAEQGGQPGEQTVNQGGQPPQPPTQGQVATTTTENPKEETTAGQRNGSRSGVWTGGEPGKGRELTAREAEWTRQRIESGARVSDQQLNMMGYKRDENGTATPAAPSAAQGNIDQEVKKANRRRRV